MSEGSGGTPWSKSPLHGMSSGIGFYSEGLSGLFNQILQSSAARAYGATEGMYTATEAAFETAQRDLRDIQMTVPQDQQADALAEYLRNSGYSSHVVEQTLGIPREEVDAALAAAGYTVTGDALPTNTKSPLELLQTGPIKTTDSSDSSATSADSITGDADLEGSLDTITAGLESSSTASTIDGSDTLGGLVTTEGTNYGWVYNKDTDTFDYGYFDLEGNRVSTGDSVKRGAVFGTENKTFKEGDTVALLPRQDGQFYIEHGGTDKYTPKAGQTIKDQQDQDFLSILNDLVSGKITLGDMQAAAKDIYGVGTVAANQAVTNATAMINKGSTNTGDVIDSITNIGGQGNTSGLGGATTGTTTTGTDTTGTTTGTTTTTGGNGNVTVINGTDGEDGRDGVDGTDGRDGVDGRDGADGADGAKGDKGDKGDKGERGASGVIALTAPIANKLFGDQFVFEDVIKPEFLGLLNLRGRR